MSLEPIVEAMGERPREVGVDYEGLAEFLGALAYPVRLQLLDILRMPHSLGEIRLSPRRGGTGSAERPAARQTVQGHLDKLVDCDLVRVEEAEQEGRRIPRYVVNPLKLYELTEEMRRLTLRHAGVGVPGEATGSMTGPAPAARVEGPRLVLVHGVYEGKSFPLDRRTATDGKWTIGRRRGLPVSLDYDPYVSLVNAVVTERRGAFHVQDLSGSKNGTAVNWTLLRRGGERELRPGDVVGVGRSLLCFVRE